MAGSAVAQRQNAAYFYDEESHRANWQCESMQFLFRKNKAPTFPKENWVVHYSIMLRAHEYDAREKVAVGPPRLRRRGVHIM